MVNIGDRLYRNYDSSLYVVSKIYIKHDLTFYLVDPVAGNHRNLESKLLTSGDIEKYWVPVSNVQDSATWQWVVPGYYRRVGREDVSYYGVCALGDMENHEAYEPVRVSAYPEEELNGFRAYSTD